MLKHAMNIFSPIIQQRLYPKTRPKPLSNWVASPKYNTVPQWQLEETKKFADDWVRWWNSAQPSWRQNADVNMLPHAVSTTKGKQQSQALKKSIRKPGPTGLLLAFVGLKWWAGIREQDPRWALALNDLSACLSFIESSDLKRSSSSNDEGGKRKKAKTKA
jgi:hypothetical protein